MTSTNRKKLAALADIGAVLRDAELARLRQSQDALRDITDRITELAAHEQRRDQTGYEEFGYFVRFQEPHRRWIAQKLQSLRRDEATAAALTEERLIAARRAFGCCAALAALSQREKKTG